MKRPETELSLIQEFFHELIRANLHFRNLGLPPENRCSVFLTSGLAVADMQVQEEAGRTLTEEEFALLARMIHRSVRKGLAGSGSEPS